MMLLKRCRVNVKISGLFLIGIMLLALLVPTLMNIKAATVSVNTSTGLVTSISQVSDSEFKTSVYCSPDASTNGNGTWNSPMTLKAAINLSKTTNGIAILLKSGTYSFGSEITITYDNNGSEGAYKVLKAAEGANVILDFSSQVYSTGARGLKLDGNYWYVYGLRIKGAADNGIYLSGSNNVIERCILEGNRDSGLQISRRDSSLTNISDWPSNNYIVNCTAFNNDDPATHENADGFASKLTCGEGNVFDGCISYCNIDDGWDLYAKPETGSIGVVTLRNCIAFNNGMKTDGTTSTNGDRNGFKLGGSSGSCPTPHIVYNCMAVNNGADGFTDNGNGAALSMYNCTSYNNSGGNFVFDRTKGGIFHNILSVTGHSSDKFVGTMDNSVYYNSSKYYKVQTAISVINGSKVGTVIAPPASLNFNSLSLPGITSDVDSLLRNADGTINVKGFLVKNDSTFSGMGAEFGISTRMLSLNVLTGGGSTTPAIDPTTGPTPTQTSPATPVTNPQTTATRPSGTTSNQSGTTAAVHSTAQVVDLSTIVKTEEIAEILKTTTDEPVVALVTDKATTLDGSIFADIQGKDKTVKLEIVNAENQIIYSWTFNGKDVTTTNITSDMKLDLSISFEVDKEKQNLIEKLNSSKEAFYISFAQHGQLPGLATIKVYVGNIYTDDTKLSLNYYNEETGNIELVNEGLMVTNGYVEFSISHCSIYFLTENEVTSVSEINSIQETDDYATVTSEQVSDNVNKLFIIIILFFVLVGTGLLITYLLKRNKTKGRSEIK